MFEISANDTAHIMGILRDTLYTDKIMAVLREYSANAWDSHRTSGKADLPIQVTLPTAEEPTLLIRDFGRGLPPDEIFSVYTKYGASTKRDSNTAVGMLGIGSKSAFAYADSFTVTSWFEGKKRTYVAALDETDHGVLNLIHEADCAEGESGVEIQVAVETRDISAFEDRAHRLYRYFEPRPIVNTPLPEPHGRAYTNGRFTKHFNMQSEWTAVMGCVPYRIDINQLTDKVPPYMLHRSGVLFFGIGEVTVSASREELKYSDATNQKLVERFNALGDEYVTTTLKEIESGNEGNWQKRLYAQELREAIENITDDNAKEMARERVTIPKKLPDGVRFVRPDGSTPDNIYVDKAVSLYLHDLPKSTTLSTFDFRTTSYIAHGTEADITAVLVEMKIDGIPTGKLSSAPRKYHGPGHRQRTPKVQHKKHCFVLTQPQRYAGVGGADAWEVVTRAPTTDDVYVILEHFLPKAADNLQRDRDMAHGLGIPFPPIYGYKNSKAKPVDPTMLTGTQYEAWRKNFLAVVKSRPGLVDWAVQRAHYDERYVYEGATSRYYHQGMAETVGRLAVHLPESHIIRVTWARPDPGEEPSWLNHIDTRKLVDMFKDHPDVVAAKKDFNTKAKAVSKKYPLLEHLKQTVEVKDALTYINKIDQEETDDNV